MKIHLVLKELLLSNICYLREVLMYLEDKNHND